MELESSELQLHFLQIMAEYRKNSSRNMQGQMFRELVHLFLCPPQDLNYAAHNNIWTQLLVALMFYPPLAIATLF